MINLANSVICTEYNAPQFNFAISLEMGSVCKYKGYSSERAAKFNVLHCGSGDGVILCKTVKQNCTSCVLI